MHNLTTVTLILSLNLILAGCFESDSEKTPPPAIPTPATGVVTNGSIYYQTNCVACHKAGMDDPSSAFGAADLAQRQDMIASDMRNYDTTSSFNMMQTFRNIPAQRVADLKAYFASVPR
ncbi:hypothetical protein MNBD_GAMMA21-27 [hydrothermal vent metagenome]|uniref:Cytochrome c domain-containing protein n=1 Tax=hydrothermal vent metagenome TaxID=652676 RepID=A0A3B1AD58_9ZZZZ